MLGLLLAFILSSLATSAAADPGGAFPEFPEGALLRDTGGDHPPVTIDSWNGAFDVEISSLAGAPTSYGFVFIEDFAISQVPQGATIEKALVVTHQWINAMFSPPENAEIVFAGNQSGPLVPSSEDLGDHYWDLRGYAVDVTPHVTGNGSYDFSITLPLHTAGPSTAHLIVVYGHDSIPAQRTLLNVGAESLQFGISTTSFAGLMAGESTLTVLVGGGGGPGIKETISFNGELVLPGPELYHHGPDGIRFTVPVQAVTGENTATVTTGEDRIAFTAAVLVNPLTTTSVESRSWSRIKSLYR